MGYIYMIRNTVNGKAYIGKTTQKPENRIRDHLDCQNKGSRLLKRAIEKYGRDAFAYEILHDSVFDIFLDEIEIAEIAKHNTLVPNGYNLTTGGEGGHHTKETLLKISKSNKGQKRSFESRRKISESLKGRQFSPEHRQRIAEANKRRKCSPESRRRMSEAQKGRKHLPEARQKIAEANKRRKGEKRKPLSLEHRRKIAGANKRRKWSSESRQKIAEANKRRKWSSESRRRMSEAQKGKSLSPEHRRKMSEANAHPDRPAAFEILNSLPESMPLAEKCSILRNKFPDRGKSTIRDWVNKWSETSL